MWNWANSRKSRTQSGADGCEDEILEMNGGTMKIRILSGVAAALLAFGAAAQSFPSRPITMIVPFPPGGVADQTARPTSAGLEKFLKQPVTINNRAGAGGAVGNAAVAHAKPDGYTIGMLLSSVSVIPAADALFDRKPAYTLKELTPIALVSADPMILIVGADSNWKSVKDLVADIKSKPGTYSFSSSGIYGALHMPLEMFFHAAGGLKLRHVPTKGGGPALQQMLGGHVNFTAGGPAAIGPFIQGGKLRPLASWGGSRHPAYPDVPTFKELGYDIEYYIWAGMFAPTGTPDAVLKVLRDATRKTVEDADFMKAMKNLNSPIVYKDAPEFQTYWDADAKRLAAAVKVVGKVEAKQ
jgi:tripartite-type tricarboxylate transporter receptor subunit TctC